MDSSPAKGSCLPKIIAADIDVAFEYFGVKKRPVFSGILYFVSYLIFVFPDLLFLEFYA